MSRNNWHVARTRFGFEAKVSDACNKIILENYCPRYKLIWTVRGRNHERHIPLFPTYIFIHFDGFDSYQWNDVYSIDGIISILGGSNPGIVTATEIERVRTLIGEGGQLDLGIREVSKYLFYEGDFVTLMHGPFFGHMAKCVWTDGDLAALKITFLGTEHVVYYPTAFCDPVDKNGLMATHRPGLVNTGKKRRGKRSLGTNRRSA